MAWAALRSWNCISSAILYQDYLKEQGVHVYDTMVGNFMTSIEMAGFSLTLLRLDDDMKALYDTGRYTGLEK